MEYLKYCMVVAIVVEGIRISSATSPPLPHLSRSKSFRSGHPPSRLVTGWSRTAGDQVCPLDSTRYVEKCEGKSCTVHCKNPRFVPQNPRQPTVQCRKCECSTAIQGMCMRTPRSCKITMHKITGTSLPDVCPFTNIDMLKMFELQENKLVEGPPIMSGTLSKMMGHPPLLLGVRSRSASAEVSSHSSCNNVCTRSSRTRKYKRRCTNFPNQCVRKCLLNRYFTNYCRTNPVFA